MRFGWRCSVGILICLCGFQSGWSADEPVKTYATPDTAQADPDFALQGEYTGTGIGVQAVAQGGGKFLLVLYRGGLPGAGWNGTDRQESDEDSDGVKNLIKDLSLKKVERQSPTLRAKAPASAVVLFDGTSETFQKHWQSGAKVDSDLLQQGCQGLDQFTDFIVHIEFRLPYMPAARSQGRGNSGLYFQGRYEVQMLDSFGLEGKDNECGGLYGVKAPDVNVCFPPLTWQTFDAEFTAARTDKDGKIIGKPRVTIRHNGVMVQQDVELPENMTGPVGMSALTGPLLLQDHGNPVRYRNIWVLPRNVEQEARRPIVPSFERFHAATGANLAAGGRLLLGELNCIACHRPEDVQAPQLTSRKSPILTDVGRRARPEYLVKFLANPHAVKSGTPMPDLLATLSAADRDKTALALVNFLVGGLEVPELGSDLQAVQRGEKLFREIGCLACHAAPEGEKVASKSAMPLGNLKEKYSLASLAGFLQDPHKVRPAGRMPSLIQEGRDAVDLASYLIGNVDFKPKNPNLRYALYHGNWDKVPKFDDLKPVKRGESAGFDMNLAGRINDFGVRFEGFLKIDQDGEYTFQLGSDDGSILYVDGKEVANSDGIHPHTTNAGRARLKKGMHALRVDYFQGGGEATLTLDFEGPGVPQQDIQRSVFLTEKGPEPKPADEAKAGFEYDPALAAQGRTLFATLGCANCHEYKVDGEAIKSLVNAPALKDLKVGSGCLAETKATGVVTAAEAASGVDSAGKGQPTIPRFDLDYHQRDAFTMALTTPFPSEPPTSQHFISQTMTAFNCYACHARGSVGGPERDRNPLFKTTIQEMGDEGRIAPPLDGVGDKLTDDWLRHVLQNGAKDRPYMLTRMPKFGLPNVGELAAAFVNADRRPASELPKLMEAEHRAKAVGRQLVGDRALACVKCHNFGEYRASGIQAINLQTMTQRIREDWFLRYMIDPPAYRPGTRMPTGFPGGKATIREVYDGNTEQQLAAIWTYLKEGNKAGIPEGLVGNVIELKPEKKPIIYRNFIEGLTPRGIAVGYPEKAHLAWDANRMCLSLIWHGRFIDAGKHWEGRGPGFQGPLGDHVMTLEETAPIALLESPATEWPTQPPREAGYHFKGYDLDKQGRPHFKYVAPAFTVEDFSQPVVEGKEVGFRRHLTIAGKDGNGQLYFRASAAGKIEAQPDGWYLIDGNVRIRIPGAKPVLRESRGKHELLVPIVLKDGKAEIVEEISW